MKRTIRIIAVVLVLTVISTASAFAASFVKFTGNANCLKRNGSSAGYTIKKGSVAKVVDSDDN